MSTTRHASLRPPPPLDAVVAQLWTSERPAGLAHAREWGLPSGEADLLLPLHGSALLRFGHADDSTPRWYTGGVLQGAMTAPTLRDTAGAACVVGAHFTPARLAARLRPGWRPDLLLAEALHCVSAGQWRQAATAWPQHMAWNESAAAEIRSRLDARSAPH